MLASKTRIMSKCAGYNMGKSGANREITKGGRNFGANRAEKLIRQQGKKECKSAILEIMYRDGYIYQS